MSPHAAEQTDLGGGSKPTLAAKAVFPRSPPHKRELSLPHIEENRKHLNGWACIAEDADIPDYNITSSGASAGNRVTPRSQWRHKAHSSESCISFQETLVMESSMQRWSRESNLSWWWDWQTVNMEIVLKQKNQRPQYCIWLVKVPTGRKIGQI